MNKRELIAVYAEAAGVSRREAAARLHILLEILTKTLAQGESVQLMGFGKLEVRERAARVVREPFEQTLIHVPASKTVTFHAGNTLKRSVAQKEKNERYNDSEKASPCPNRGGEKTDR